MAITPPQRKKFFESRDAGFSIAQSAKRAKISDATAYRLLRANKDVDTEIHDYGKGVARKNNVAGQRLQRHCSDRGSDRCVDQAWSDCYDRRESPKRFSRWRWLPRIRDGRNSQHIRVHGCWGRRKQGALLFRRR